MELKLGYKQTEVGVIPEDWEVQHLGDVAAITTGWKDVNEGNPAGEYPFFTCSRSHTFSDQYSFDMEAILIAGNGDVGNLHYYSGRFEAYQRTYVVHKFSRPVRYVWHQLDYRLIESLGLGKIGTSIPYIKRENLAGFAFPVPATESEQRTIAGALSDADALIESLEQLIAKKRHLKQGAMEELLTGKTRLPGFAIKTGYQQTEVGVIPDDWEVVSADSIGRFRGGSGFPTVDQGNTSGDYPFFKVSDMNNEGNETFMEAANNYISEQTRVRLGATAFPPNTIVFAKVGAAVFLERKKLLAKPSCLDNNMVGYILSDNRVDHRYIHFFLLTFRLGSLVNTTALPSLSGSVLNKIKIVLPPTKAEQTAIAAILNDMDAEIATLEAKLTKARQLKQGMMQELLTGRIRLV